MIGAVRDSQIREEQPQQGDPRIVRAPDRLLRASRRQAPDR